MTALGLKKTMPAARAHLLPKNLYKTSTTACGTRLDAPLHGIAWVALVAWCFEVSIAPPLLCQPHLPMQGRLPAYPAIPGREPRYTIEERARLRACNCALASGCAHGFSVEGGARRCAQVRASAQRRRGSYVPDGNSISRSYQSLLKQKLEK